MGALVEAHGPAAHPLAGLADPLRGLADGRLVQAGVRGDVVGGVFGEELRHHLPAFGELLDKGRMGVAVPVQQVQQAVEQQQVGTGPDLQEQVGLVRRGVAPGVDDYQFGPGLDPVHQAQEQDRVAVGHVGADDEEHIGLVEVLIGAGRAVRTQRQLVAAAGAGHAQARVGLDLVAAEVALDQLVGQVLGFQRHLPGHVQGDGVRAVLVENGAQARGRGGDGFGHGRTYRLARTLAAQVGVLHAPGLGERLVAGAALGAQAAEVGRVLFVAGHLDHLAASHLHDDAAADAAVGTHTPNASVRHTRTLDQKRKTPCRPPSKRWRHGVFVVDGQSALIALQGC
ncbi:hypothetical protein FQZ97_656330 [compost metagenome]